MERRPSLVRSDHSTIPPSIAAAAARQGKVSTYRDRLRLTVHPLVAQVNAAVDQRLEPSKANGGGGHSPGEHELLMDAFRQYSAGVASPPDALVAGTANLLLPETRKKAATAPGTTSTKTGSPKRAASPTAGGKLTPLLRAQTPLDLLPPRPHSTAPSASPAAAVPHHDDGGDGQSKQAIVAAINERFGGAFRPVSVSSDRLFSATPDFTRGRPATSTSTGSPRQQQPPPRTSSRSQSIAPSYDVLMKTITREGAIARRESRAYVRNVTDLLRQDDFLLSAFASQYEQSSDRSAASAGHQIEEANKQAAFKIREIAEQQHQKREAHSRHCEAVYEAKQHNIVADYMKLEEEIATVRGEQFSRGRLWLGLMTSAKVFMCLRSIVDKRRSDETDEFVKSVYMQHSASNNNAAHAGPISPLERTFRVKSPSMAPSAPLVMNLDIISGVHKTKFQLVEQRRDMQRQCLARDPDGLKRLVVTLKNACMGYWLKRAIRRKQAAALVILLEFLRRAKERARARIAIKSFLHHTKLLVRRWKEAFRRERERIASVGRQWDHYMAERVAYDRVTCADADREVKRREKAVAKASIAKKQTETSVAQALSPLRSHRAAVERTTRAGSVFKEIAAPAPPPLTPLQISRIVAAPFMLPHPFGPKLGPDPTSSRIAALATLNVLGFDRMIWKVPARTKDFVIRFLIARERVAHALQISKWCNDVTAAEAKHRALLSVATIATGSTLAQVTQELAKFTLPRMPRRQVFLKPNEIRFWIHFAIVLYAQERRQAHDNNVNEKFVDPATVAAVYNVRNATAVMKRCLAQLGEKLSSIRPGYFDDLPYAIEVPPPTIPDSLLVPGSKRDTAAPATATV